ncbi:MAG: hypothetical protein AB3N17_09000 [Tateyamaria sp.]
MTTVFRSLRRFSIFYFVVLLLLLIGRLVVASFSRSSFDGGFRTGPISGNVGAVVFQGIDIVLLVLTLLGTVVLVVFLILVVIAFLRWLILQIIDALAVSQTTTLSKLLGLVAVAVFFSQLVTDLYTVARNLVINLFTTFPGSLTEAFRSGMSCIENNSSAIRDVVDSVCVSGIFFDAVRTVRAVATELFGSTGLGRIDPVSAMMAIALFLIVTLITAHVRAEKETKNQFWLAYGGVALFATYLTLSAILAVPLLSEDDGTPPRPATELQTNLEGMWTPPAPREAAPQSDETSLQALFAADAVATPQAEEDVPPLDVELWVADFRATARNIDGQIDRLDGRREEMRQNIDQTVRNYLSAAVLSYESEVAVRRGEREASRHFVDLTNWFQFVIDEQSFALSRCRAAIENANRTYSASRDFMSRTLDRGHSGTRADALQFLERLSRMLDEERAVVVNSIREAELSCDFRSNNRFVPPTRSEYGSFLGVVGTSVSWLLSTESMEVALLTGLIGFGLLGSLVAQFVKSGGAEEFKISRIATVVFSGFCAAIVVYVTAYGGLAVASMSADDPNPYVVFGACLVGAVYSAEIWERAKKWLTTGNPNG